MDIDKNARQTPKGRERASRSAKRWRLPALSSRLLAAYGSRRGRAARTERILQRRHSAVGGVRRGELGRAIEDPWLEAARLGTEGVRRAACGRWAFSIARAQRYL